MKTLVMTLIFAVNGMTSAATPVASNGFAYNAEVNDHNQVTSQYVYKADGQYLEHHLKYDYTYDEAGRVVKKEVFRWDEIDRAYERYYCLAWDYDAEGVSLEYALWNELAEAYSDAKQRAEYSFTCDGLNYQAYDWDSRRGEWQLQAEHSVTDDALLLAEADAASAMTTDGITR